MASRRAVVKGGCGLRSSGDERRSRDVRTSGNVRGSAHRRAVRSVSCCRDIRGVAGRGASGGNVRTAAGLLRGCVGAGEAGHVPAKVRAAPLPLSSRPERRRVEPGPGGQCATPTRVARAAPGSRRSQGGSAGMTSSVGNPRSTPTPSPRRRPLHLSSRPERRCAAAPRRAGTQRPLRDVDAGGACGPWVPALARGLGRDDKLRAGRGDGGGNVTRPPSGLAWRPADCLGRCRRARHEKARSRCLGAGPRLDEAVMTAPT